MRDPFTWSVPLGRLFGVTIRVHLLFPLVAVALILRVAFAKEPTATEPGFPPGTTYDAMLLMGILFGSVLLHEFGHCFGARLADGDAQEVLLWPLGGLAAIEVPHRPRAHLIATAAGPLTNLLLCVVSAFFLIWLSGFEVRPPLNPFWSPYRGLDESKTVLAMANLHNWAGVQVDPHKFAMTLTPVVILARVFWMNWVLFLLNTVIIGFPLDGGRLFQCALWPWYGFAQATRYAIYAGFVMTIIIAIAAIAKNEVLTLCLALFIYVTCRQQWILLETGGEESLFGYDFSQGYTSLEGDPPPPRRRRVSLWQRWLQRRAQAKRQREQEVREAEEKRMDELLEKVQRGGLASLTDEERRFLKRVSDRYRHRS
jgi:Zn-dependent protease